ncbi:MAG: deoxyribodipyrimidine photo-lyase [Hyphomonadaceae bacterium]|nr:deoxyribodipyrimidine photo-lyase [Hyphomonadaceae bacterium]
MPAANTKHPADAPVIVWFRQDLRLADNPALTAAVGAGRPVILVYILDDETPWPMGGASRWWLHGSLSALAADIEARGGRLTLRRGPSARTIAALVAETRAAAVFWNRCYEPAAVARDTGLKKELTDSGVAAESFNAALLFEPWEVRTGGGGPFKVYSPFWRASLARGVDRHVLPAPRAIPSGAAVSSASLEDFNLLPRKPDWAGGMRAAWTPGEAGARRLLDAFLEGALEGYGDRRNRPDIVGTSRLSPHLHFGEIGPRQIWNAVEAHVEAHPGRRKDGDKFLSEIGWREFSTHLLFHNPDLPEANWKATFDAFPWENNPEGLEAWKRGRTGYPIVDAGMRELWVTGWMHNRVRMIVASFLIKDLMVHWREGEAWFWDTLVDADLANNAASWQWVAGSGADAAPYFRIFNPVTQGETYDPGGDYVRRWIPEIAALPDKVIHKPWTATPEVLSAAGVDLGRTYPRPIVDHGEARQRALAAYKSIAGASAGE